MELVLIRCYKKFLFCIRYSDKLRRIRLTIWIVFRLYVKWIDLFQKSLKIITIELNNRISWKINDYSIYKDSIQLTTNNFRCINKVIEHKQ